MSDIIPQKNTVLNIYDSRHHQLIAKICHALSAPERIRIMQYLLNNTKTLSEISSALNIPISSISRHIDVLTNVGLTSIRYEPSLKGHTKFYSQAMLSYTVSLCIENNEDMEQEEYTTEIPVGLFSHCHITPPCGMLSSTSPIGEIDSPNVFFSSQRIEAELIWFALGFISYKFPVPDFKTKQPSEISVSFEICSETVYYNNKWPSDITIYINQKETVTITSPGDFGGRRGKFTPEYWPVTSTQFGRLNKITVNSKGVFVNDMFIHSSITFSDLNIHNYNSENPDYNYIRLDIGIKKDALHKGGINLFGKNFGDYNQAISIIIK